MSESQLGTSLATYFITATIGSFALGGVAERLGWTVGLRSAALLSTITLAAIGLGVASWWGLQACLFVGGLSGALAQPASNLALVRGIPRRQQGISFGAKQAAIPLAVLLGGLAVPALAVTVGWRAAFLVAAAVALLATWLVPIQATRLDPLPKTARQPLRGAWSIICLGVAGGLGAAAGNALGGFLVLAGVATGLSEEAAARLLIHGSLVGLAMRLLVGWVANRQYRRSLDMLVVLLCFGAAGFALLALNQGNTLLPGTLLAFGAGWSWSGVFHLAVVLANEDAPASATGFTQAGIFAGAALGPFVFGVLAEHVSFSKAWWIAALWQILAALLVIFSRRFTHADPRSAASSYVP